MGYDNPNHMLNIVNKGAEWVGWCALHCTHSAFDLLQEFVHFNAFFFCNFNLFCLPVRICIFLP